MWRAQYYIGGSSIVLFGDVETLKQNEPRAGSCFSELFKLQERAMEALTSIDVSFHELPLWISRELDCSFLFSDWD